MYSMAWHAPLPPGLSGASGFKILGKFLLSGGWGRSEVFILVREDYIVDSRVILLAGWSRNFEVKIKTVQRVFLE